MLIEISESVVSKAESGDYLALQVLQELAMCQSRSYHIIWGTRSVLRRIRALNGLSDLDTRIYDSILRSWATSASEIHKVKNSYYVLVSYNQPTQRGTPTIINPQQTPQFNYDCKTNMLVENILDADLYKYIGDYYLRQNTITEIKINFESIPGGGSCTSQKYQDYINHRESFCICLLDGDKKFSTIGIVRGASAPNGETFKKVNKIDRKAKPFNCVCSATDKVCEVENLIPVNFYLLDDNFKDKEIVKNSIAIDLSYYDLKKGLLIKRLGKTYVDAYWKAVFSTYPKILNDIDFYEAMYNSCDSSQEFNRLCGDQTIIGGFGEDLLKYTLDNHADDLSKVSNTDLSPSQESEWNSIGKKIVSWCCCIKVQLNRL